MNAALVAIAAGRRLCQCERCLSALFNTLITDWSPAHKSLDTATLTKSIARLLSK